ncbi:MAG: hypothetical protein J6L76_07095 [Clostridia bacterium]|nr:hypothetical protein [Clostridia bacterium]
MNKLVELLAVVIGGGLLLLMFIGFVERAMDFRQELQYLEMEIARTEGAEQAYWKRQKRALWLSLPPFYR